MGGGIAMSFADHGVPVQVLEASPDALERGMARIRNNYATSVQRGSLAQADMDRRLALISGVTDYDTLGGADVVIEAIFEEMAPKKQVFARLDQVMNPAAFLLPTSSALHIAATAPPPHRPHD